MVKGDVMIPTQGEALGLRVVGKIKRMCEDYAALILEIAQNIEDEYGEWDQVDELRALAARLRGE